MMNHRPLSSVNADRVNQLARRWAPKLIFLSLLVVVVSTLYPFKFTIAPEPVQAILYSFRSRSSVSDVLANILLFMPLGFGLASAIASRRLSPVTKFLVITLLCSLISFFVEILQVFLPGRKPTPLDIVSNGLGGGVGYLVFAVGGATIYLVGFWLFTVFRTWCNQRSLQQLLIGLGSYVAIASVLIFSWQSMNLKSWDLTVPLAIGSPSSRAEPTLQPPDNSSWQGTLADLIISDRALTKADAKTFFADPHAFAENNSAIIAAYSLQGPTGLRDRTGHSPPLVWQTDSPALDGTAPGLTISADQWVQTVEPATYINERIRHTAQFAISAIVRTAVPAPPTPAVHPILSLAEPSTLASTFGNFALGQYESNLVVSLSLVRNHRDRHTYHRLIPNVFTDTTPHRLLVTYSGFTLRVYVDSTEWAYLADFTPNRHQIVLYGIILMPLALLIALIADRLRRNRWSYLILIGIGTLLPSIFLESILASGGDRTVRLTNLLLGIVIVGGTILALPRRMSPTPKHL